MTNMTNIERMQWILALSNLDFDSNKPMRSIETIDSRELLEHIVAAVLLGAGSSNAASDRVRMANAVAENPNTPEYLLEILAKTVRDENVKISILSHPNCTSRVVDCIAERSSQYDMVIAAHAMLTGQRAHKLILKGDTYVCQIIAGRTDLTLSDGDWARLVLNSNGDVAQKAIQNPNAPETVTLKSLM